MKKFLILSTLTAVLLSSCITATNSIPGEPELSRGFTVDFSEPEETIYSIASKITGCPERILRGIAFAESTYRADAVGDDGISIGLCQINEKFHSDRVRLIGREYNPWCPLDNLIVAGANYVDNLNSLGCERLAITAHKEGKTGAKAGEVTWYVERVLNAPELVTV